MACETIRSIVIISRSQRSMAGTTSTSEYLNSKQRVLNKKQIETIVGSVEAVDRIKVLKSVKDDVGRHLDVFQERRSAWNAVSVNPKFDLFVLSAVKKYTTLVRECCVGKNKYSNLLMNGWSLCVLFSTIPRAKARRIGVK